jgi:PIN domain nuclease of toxin-antitoxin system
MMFDTDVLIWVLRGNQAAAGLLDTQAERAVSIVSVMELHQGARSHEESRAIRRFFQNNSFRVIPINEAISHLATTLVEDHAMKDGLRVADCADRGHSATKRHNSRNRKYPADAFHFGAGAQSLPSALVAGSVIEPGARRVLKLSSSAWNALPNHLHG